MSLGDAMDPISKFQSWCMVCCTSREAIMLTGYCLHEMRCDKCGRYSDLAMVKVTVPGIVPMSLTEAHEYRCNVAIGEFSAIIHTCGRMTFWKAQK